MIALHPEGEVLHEMAVADRRDRSLTVAARKEQGRIPSRDRQGAVPGVDILVSLAALGSETRAAAT